jgi:hypothetical protein
MNLSQIVFVGIIIAALAALGLACKTWFAKGQAAELPTWRKVIFSLGILAVVGQVVLFVLFWTKIGSDYGLFAEWARMVYPSFLVAAVCIFAGKGAARRWLFASSVLLFIVCFFMMLSP